MGMTKLTNCIQCGKKRTIPKKTYASRAAYQADEFCSRKCVEANLGIVHPKGHCSTDYRVPA